MASQHHATPPALFNGLRPQRGGNNFRARESECRGGIPLRAVGGQIGVADARAGVGAVPDDQLVEAIAPPAFAARARDREYRRAGGDLAPFAIGTCLGGGGTSSRGRRRCSRQQIDALIVAHSVTFATAEGAKAGKTSAQGSQPFHKDFARQVTRFVTSAAMIPEPTSILRAIVRPAVGSPVVARRFWRRCVMRTTS